MANKTLEFGDGQSRQAMKRYNENFNARLYNQATARKSVGYANRLIDDALAICGSPHYAISDRRYSKEAMTFLEAFALPVDPNGWTVTPGRRS